MGQLLHIFRKDVRRLWPGILIVSAMIIAHAVADVRSEPVYIPATERINALVSLLSSLLPIGLWFLIAQLIFQETLPGDRQFWLTRPYRWVDLLGSKILFMSVFASVPLFASDCYILGIQGFPVFGVLPELLLRQLAVAALFILPAFAIATIIAGLPQFVLAVFVALLVLVAEFLSVSRGASVVGPSQSGSVVFVAFVVILTGVVFWQYAKRRTTAARVFLLVATAAFFPATWSLSRVLQGAPPTLPASPNGFNVGFQCDLHRSPSHPSSWQAAPEGYAVAFIPLSVSGLPPNTLLRGQAEIKMEADGKPWPEYDPIFFGEVERADGEYWQKISLPRAALKSLKQRPVNLRTTFRLTVVNDRVEETIPLIASRLVVPNVGHCHLREGLMHRWLVCRAGLGEAVETSIRLDAPGTEGRLLAEVPALAKPWGLSPTSETLSAELLSPQTGSAISIIPRRQLAEFQRSIEASNIELSSYVNYGGPDAWAGYSL